VEKEGRREKELILERIARAKVKKGRRGSIDAQEGVPTV